MLVASRLRNSYVAHSSLDLADRDALQPLARLLSAVRKAIGDIPLVLVGAAARDVRLVHAHGLEPRRATEDTDVALAVRDWDTFLRAREALVASGAFKADGPAHRLCFGDQRVDIIPLAESSGVTGASLGPRKATTTRPSRRPQAGQGSRRSRTRRCR
jgi:predicted nucleotidyltransferase